MEMEAQPALHEDERGVCLVLGGAQRHKQLRRIAVSAAGGRALCDLCSDGDSTTRASTPTAPTKRVGRQWHEQSSGLS